MKRRQFLAAGAAATLGAAGRPVRIGSIGTGNRGSSLMRVAMRLDAQVKALCDPDPAALERAQAMVEKAGQPKPEGYSGPEDFRRLVARDDLDAVLIATPWEFHTPIAVAAMKAGKYVGVEVPAAQTVEQCWELVNTSEQTGVPCMMLENWSFRRDNLAVLNMIRQGLMGEIVHCHCAHSHNCIYWYFDKQGNPRWSGNWLLKRNADQYPTHSLGPVLSWMDINTGDSLKYLTATASRSLGMNRDFARRLGPDHPAAKRRYMQGDIVTSVVKTEKGNTIVINNDMQLPRPYDNRWEIQGTEGLYNEQRNSVYLLNRSPKYEEWEPFGPYQEKYEHRWWQEIRSLPPDVGHGGTDYLELREFLNAVRNRTKPPIDVYDSAVMSVVVALSAQSIANGSAPVPCPDFTRGKWKTRKPAFGV
ncbi:MAG TPA: Gfo/Idh/MocA family oxidoreductase [Bryobacteraceae bacterium]|nr:Gfo/Idh/MocA family oxidoreductase [Bryobacteraceae bacterium]